MMPDISAEQLEAVLPELEQLIAEGREIQLVLGPLEAFTVLGSIQLACRHPENAGQAAALAESIGRRIQEALAPAGSRFAELMELSWNKQCRACGCTNETPCIGPDGQPCHWAGPSICSNCVPRIVLPGDPFFAI